MSEMKKIFVGQKIKSFPARTYEKLIRGEERDRDKSRPDDVRTGATHSPVVCKLRWDNETDVGPGAVVKLGDPLFPPTDENEEVGTSGGLVFAATPFDEGDPLANYAITLGPINGVDDGKHEVGYGVIPEAWWTKINITDESHTHATITAAGTQFGSSTSGQRILWKPSGTGVKWAVVLLAGSGGGSSAVDVKIVLIDQDIPGVDEYDPLENAAVTLTSEEITAGYEIVFQDPPDDDYDVNQVDNLNLYGYKRRQLSLKYFTSDPNIHAGTATAGSTTTITLENTADLSDTDDFYVGDTIVTTAGTGSGQTRTITNYVASTRVATVSPTWTAPSSDTEYEITSSLTKVLVTTVIDDAEHEPPRKVVRYATTTVYYDDGVPFECGEYTRADYPDYDENTEFPPDGLPDGFLTKKYRGIAIGNVLITALCKPLPAPVLP